MKIISRLGFGIQQGPEIAAHIHLVAPAKFCILKSDFCQGGRVRADVYSQEKKFLRAVELGKGTP